MMREVIKTGKTVEEATMLALAELGLAEEEVTIEVIDLPQKKFFKSIPAKVRVTVDAEIEEARKAAAAPPAPPRPKPAPEKPVVAAPKAPAFAARPVVPAAAPAPKAPAEKKDALAPAAPPRPPQRDFPEVPIDLAQNEKAKDAVEYLKELCMLMGNTSITINAMQQGEAIVLKVDGEDAGNLIGHRGEVMEALSYLTGLVANRSGGDYTKINLDINRYRSKREANLVALARRIGAKVAKTGRSHTLEPMNPYERRIIHSAISEMEQVRSESTGEGSNRRVVILCTSDQARAERPFRQAGRGPIPAGRGPVSGNGPSRNGPPRTERTGGDRGPRRNGDFAPKSNVPGRDFADRPREAGAEPTVPKRTETIDDSASLPLYGKIEL